MSNEYKYAVGRRKTSVVTVRLYEKKGKSTLNDKPIESIYDKDYEITKIYKPFELLGIDKDKFYFTAVAKGGGKYSQLDALVLGLSRGLVKLDQSYKKVLKDNGLLTRDPRMVERKKTGLKKARKAEQYTKR